MAYGARLESALSESSRGFESPILRKQNDRLSGGLFVCWGFLGWIRTFAGAPSASRSGDFGGHSPQKLVGRISLLRESLRRRVSLSSCRHKLANFAEAEWRHVHIDVFALARIDYVGFVINANGRGASRRLIERLPSG